MLTPPFEGGVPLPHLIPGGYIMTIGLYQNRMWIRGIILWFVTIKSAINWGYIPYNAVLIWHMYGKIQFGSMIYLSVQVIFPIANY